MTKPVRKITKKQTQTAVQEIQSGANPNITFFNKSVAKRLKKNKEKLLREETLQENAKKLSEKMMTKQNAAPMPKPDIKNPVDYTAMDDDKLVSSIIVLGVTPADLIEGGIDAVRALRLYSEAQAKVVARHRAMNTGVRVPAPAKK